MGNFEKLSVLVIVVIIVMILVVALYTWTDNPDGGTPPATKTSARGNILPGPGSDAGGGGALGNGALGNGAHGGGLLEDWDSPSKREGIPESADQVGTVPEVPEVPKVKTVEEPLPVPEPEKEERPAPEAAEPWMYTVQPGDTLTQISERELGTWRRYKEILKLNAGVKAETIRAGDTLKMPPKQANSSLKVTPATVHAGAARPAARGKIALGDTYVIRKGDRLSTISKRAYGTIDRWPELWARNLSVIDDPDEPKVGAHIFIPK